jgi:glutamate-1-semialdehyde 2,1-aminomutase
LSAGAPTSTSRSAELYRRALQLLPGGVNSPVRAMGSIGRDPIFVAGGSGSRIRDVDGNEYVDWVGSWGPLVLGHAHPDVVAAVVEAAAAGTSFGAPTEGEVELAAEVAARMPSVEMLRMTSSGTEATMSAIRLARAATGRELILKFAGAYHGHVDGLLAQAGSGLATQGIPASPGVTAAAAVATVIVPWNNADAFCKATDHHEFAAIIAEPIPANMGVVPPDTGFLPLLRQRASANGALLIFDEVITGFRVAPGGAQQYYGVTPDLTIMGKIVGGGLPAAAYGGARALMQRIAPAGDVYQAGTLSGNHDAAYTRLRDVTERLAAGLREAAASAGRDLRVHDVPGLLTPFFTARAVFDYADAAGCDQQAYGEWCRALLERGVYPPPSQFEAWFPSLAHSDEDVERTVQAAADAFEQVAR